MISKLIDAEIIINNKKIPILNTELFIEVEWDVLLEKKTAFAELKISFLSIKGWFEWYDIKENYKKKIRIEFHSDETWKLTPENQWAALNIQPFTAHINFDKKEAKIKIA